jgi:AraC-like DNA-binding protein
VVRAAAVASGGRGGLLNGMQKIVFSSDELPAELGDRVRMARWRENYPQLSSFDTSYLDDKPFSVRFEFLQFGGAQLIQFEGTVGRVARTPRHIAADSLDGLCITFNSGRSPYSVRQRGREAIVDPGRAVLHANTDPFEFSARTDSGWVGVGLSRKKLVELVGGAEDLVAASLDPGRPAMRHLRRYLAIIFGPDGIGDDALLIEHAEATILGLAALALGEGRDAARIAGMGGLRSVRVQDLLVEIRAGFADPAFSPAKVALKLGLSPRYLQDLLQETGLGFTERVLELRLQKACAMLADPSYNGRKVSEIAYACGFNEASYFNRCFRRRFGASPTQFRQGSGD